MNPEQRARIAEAWPRLLAGLAAGDLIKTMLAREGLDRYHVSDYKLSVPGAKAAWDEARAASADSFMDEALDNARGPMEDPQAARVLIDTLKWAARIRNPAMYGDKSQVDVNVKTIDLTRIIQDANARLIAAQSGRVIEHDRLALTNISDHTDNNSELAPAITHAQSADQGAGTVERAFLAGLL